MSAKVGGMESAPRVREIGGYPISIFFIVGNEFCERFSYYGMRTILVLFFKQWIGWSDSTATSMYHAFAMLCYFFPLLGAMLADGYLGKYKTIIILSIVYCLGHVIKALTSFPPPEWYGSVVGLFLIALGTGGIKPCVSAFGGDQFRGDQTKKLGTFFAIFYFAINAGSAISTFVSPIFRADVQCFDNDCYALAFGIPAALMLLATIIFIAGKSMYVINPPTDNPIAKTIKATAYAIKNRKGKKDHWLDHAGDKYDHKFLDDMKAMYRVIFMFLPIPVFWALFDQQGSTWTLQATKMDGTLGSVTLKPDQIQTLNPVLIMLLIPVFEKGIYPLMEKLKMPLSPLKRMTAGMVLAAAAFVIAGFIQIRLDSLSYEPVSSGLGRINFISSANCPLTIASNPPLDGVNPSFAVDQGTNSGPEDVEPGNYTLTLQCPRKTNGTVIVEILEGQEYFLVTGEDNTQSTIIGQLIDDYGNSAEEGEARIRVVSALPPNILSGNSTIYLAGDTDDYITYNVTQFSYSEEFFLIDITKTYRIWMKNQDGEVINVPGEFEFKSGAVNSIVVELRANNEIAAQTYEHIGPNSLSMMWQIPQYFVMTSGEVMLSITGLSFAYSQAPKSMKSVLQAAWLLTVAFGNLIVIIIEIIVGENSFESQSGEFFLFAGLMTAFSIVFAIMSWRYVYIEFSEDEEEEDEEKKEGLELNGNGNNNPAYDTDGEKDTDDYDTKM